MYTASASKTHSTLIRKSSTTSVALLFGQSTLSPQTIEKRVQHIRESPRKLQPDAKSTAGNHIFTFMGITHETGDILYAVVALAQDINTKLFL